jgi:transcriptional regulator with XRE-family HTH domain
MNYDERTKQEIGNQIRYFRLEAGLTAEELASRLKCGRSRLTKIELGMLRPSEPFIRSLSKCLRLSVKEQEPLLEATRSLFERSTPWRILASDGFANLQRQVSETEKNARSIQSFQPLVIPGLLQTTAYARNILRLSNCSDLDEAVGERIGRQTILEDRRRSFQFIIHEAALRRLPIASMHQREQISRLLGIMQLPNVCLAILPFSAAPKLAFLHGFTIVDDVVRLETLAHRIVFSDGETRRRYATYFQKALRSSRRGAKAKQFLSSLI